MKRYQHYKRSVGAVVIGIAAPLLIASFAYGSSIENLGKAVGGLSELIRGNLGIAMVWGGTIGGIGLAFFKGNVWLAVGILAIGMMLGFHLDNMMALFKVN